MRIISFSKKWPKLQQPEFTTFRYTRKDKDWYAYEVVQVYYKNRSPQRERLGIAKIKDKEPKLLADITHEEAVGEGCVNLYAMFEWLEKNHNGRDMFQPINKLTLRWVS